MKEKKLILNLDERTIKKSKKHTTYLNTKQKVKINNVLHGLHLLNSTNKIRIIIDILENLNIKSYDSLKVYYDDKEIKRLIKRTFKLLKSVDVVGHKKHRLTRWQLSITPFVEPSEYNTNIVGTDIADEISTIENGRLPSDTIKDYFIRVRNKNGVWSPTYKYHILVKHNTSMNTYNPLYSNLYSHNDTIPLNHFTIDNETYVIKSNIDPYPITQLGMTESITITHGVDNSDNSK